MCLQWCHVRDVLVDNDIPCTALCPDEIRLAKANETCETCAHLLPDGRCALTGENPPLARTCCHHNAPQRQFDFIVLRMGVNVPPELAAAHGVQTTRDIFDMVDSAPELPPETPADGFYLDARALVVPLVYGVCADCWEQALTGRPDMWCALCLEKVP